MQDDSAYSTLRDMVQTLGTASGAPVRKCSGCEIREKAFCGALDNESLMRVAAMTTEVHYAAPQSILYEGDKAEHAFNVCHGVVRVSRMLADGRRQITGFLFQGDFIGLSQSEHYDYSAEAVTDVELCRFPRARLMSLCNENRSLEHELFRMATNELSSAQEQILLLGRKTARERVASFILKLSRLAVARGEPADPVAVPMARADIADFLGLTIETVSRTITRLAKDGVIDLVTTHQIRILDRDRLEEIEVGIEEGG